jgi:hypothetical protein
MLCGDDIRLRTGVLQPSLCRDIASQSVAPGFGGDPVPQGAVSGARRRSPVAHNALWFTIRNASSEQTGCCRPPGCPWRVQSRRRQNTCPNNCRYAEPSPNRRLDSRGAVSQRRRFHGSTFRVGRTARSKACSTSRLIDYLQTKINSISITTGNSFKRGPTLAGWRWGE